MKALIIALGLLLAAQSAAALSRGALLIEGETFEVVSGKQHFLCAALGAALRSGELDPTDSRYFIPFSAKADRLARTIRKASGRRTLVTLRRQLRSVRARAIQGDAACAAGPDDPPALPCSDFTADGDITFAGRVRFGVPATLQSNRRLGEEVFLANCTSCHSERGAGIALPSLRDTLRRRAGLSLLERDLANLIAYLNRCEGA